MNYNEFDLMFELSDGVKVYGIDDSNYYGESAIELYGVEYEKMINDSTLKDYTVLSDKLFYSDCLQDKDIKEMLTGGRFEFEDVMTCIPFIQNVLDNGNKKSLMYFVNESEYTFDWCNSLESLLTEYNSVIIDEEPKTVEDAVAHLINEWFYPMYSEYEERRVEEIRDFEKWAVDMEETVTTAEELFNLSVTNPYEFISIAEAYFDGLEWIEHFGFINHEYMYINHI